MRFNNLREVSTCDFFAYLIGEWAGAIMQSATHR